MTRAEPSRAEVARSARLRLPQVLLAALSLASCALAPSAPPGVDVQSLRSRPRASWTQPEREFAFGHWDEAFRSRVVPRGERVKALPPGAVLPTFEPGGEGDRQLQRNVDDFQLAGIVVLHEGRLRLERYARGHSAEARWTSFSMAKSVTSTLMGAALRDGAVRSIDDPLTRYIPELKGSAYDGVTVRQLLTMTSGARWNEDYTDPAADVARFYSTPVEAGSDATVAYMSRLVREAPPGTRWHYNTGETNLLGVVVARATGKDLATYASEKIWSRYGMEEDATWTLDRSGHEQAGCCLQATTRDFARFGQFVLEGARIDGRAVVADGWIEAATRKQADIGAPARGYGYQWWTADDGTFSAIGIHGQQIHVDPGRRLVVAINSAWPQASFTAEALRARIGLLSAIKKALDAERQGAPGIAATPPRVARVRVPGTCTASAALSASMPLERATHSGCRTDR